MELSSFLIVTATLLVVALLVMLDVIRTSALTAIWVVALAFGGAAFAYVVPNLIA